ncbi:MAG: glycosyltransferase family 25 protein [Hyphomicrobium sp.]|jgi:glycosyl transferase family 25
MSREYAACVEGSGVGAVSTSAPLATKSPAADELPVFYINRECDAQRRQSITTYIDAAKLKAERVAGVEGLNVPEQFRQFFFEGDALHSKLKAGEVGCYASHLVAMQLIIQRNLSHALILEDDAILPADLNETLAEVIASLPKGWDIVHLCKDSSRAVKVVASLDGNRRLVRYSRVPETTTGYLVSHSGAEKFLKPMKRYWPVDTDFRQPWRFGLEIYGITPRIISPSDFESAIHQMGNHSRLRRGLPIPSRYCWTGNPLHTPEGVVFNLKTLGPVTWSLCAAHNTGRRLVSMLGLRPLIRRLGLQGIGTRFAENIAVR